MSCSRRGFPGLFFGVVGWYLVFASLLLVRGVVRVLVMRISRIHPNLFPTSLLLSTSFNLGLFASSVFRYLNGGFVLFLANEKGYSLAGSFESKRMSMVGSSGEILCWFD
jgi:hypothetical protein